jgi:hypothetical protein
LVAVPVAGSVLCAPREPQSTFVWKMSSGCFSLTTTKPWQKLPVTVSTVWLEQPLALLVAGS